MQKGTTGAAIAAAALPAQPAILTGFLVQSQSAGRQWAEPLSLARSLASMSRRDQLRLLLCSCRRRRRDAILQPMPVRLYHHGSRSSQCDDWDADAHRPGACCGENYTWRRKETETFLTTIVKHVTVQRGDTDRTAPRCCDLLQFLAMGACAGSGWCNFSVVWLRHFAFCIVPLY
jgi:hypothetical protein